MPFSRYHVEIHYVGFISAVIFFAMIAHWSIGASDFNFGQVRLISVLVAVAGLNAAPPWLVPV